MSKLYTFPFLLLLLLPMPEHLLHAQEVRTAFTHFKEFNKQDSNKLFFRFENLNFIKNNEYGSNFSNGATNIGYIATPKLVYYAASTFRIEAGVRLQKYSGRENFTESEPVFSAVYQPSDKITFILGSLNQNNNHNLSQPTFEQERFFSDHAENGFQIRYNSNRLLLDTWLNWEQFIFKNDPFQEKFTFGASGNWHVLQLENSSLSIPFEAIVTHLGGEIDASDDPVQKTRNVASGLQFTRKINDSKLTSWTLKAMAYHFIDKSSRKKIIFDSGCAIYPQFEITTAKSQLTLGYWNAYRFASPKGSELFQSLSYNKPGYFEKRRELATLHYYYEHKITNGIHLGGKLDLYYDLKNSENNFTTAVYLRVNGNFFLRKIKWQ